MGKLLDVNGSPEYELTWSSWAMPVGPPICRLRASARRTSANGFGGWPTATQSDTRQYSEKALLSFAETGNVSGHHMDLNAAAQMAGWPTPNVPNGGRSVAHAEMRGATFYHKGKKVQLGLEAMAKMAGWPTPERRSRRAGVGYKRIQRRH